MISIDMLALGICDRGDPLGGTCAPPSASATEPGIPASDSADRCATSRGHSLLGAERCDPAARRVAHQMPVERRLHVEHQDLELDARAGQALDMVNGRQRSVRIIDGNGTFPHLPGRRADPAAVQAWRQRRRSRRPDRTTKRANVREPHFRPRAADVIFAASRRHCPAEIQQVRSGQETQHEPRSTDDDQDADQQATTTSSAAVRQRRRPPGTLSSPITASAITIVRIALDVGAARHHRALRSSRYRQPATGTRSRRARRRRPLSWHTCSHSGDRQRRRTAAPTVPP